MILILIEGHQIFTVSAKNDDDKKCLGEVRVLSKTEDVEIHLVYDFQKGTVSRIRIDTRDYCRLDCIVVLDVKKYSQ